eukprot:scaffold8533_cov248-Pinguiococcus_pyrenoidosus.AAC.1
MCGGRVTANGIDQRGTAPTQRRRSLAGAADPRKPETEERAKTAAGGSIWPPPRRVNRWNRLRHHMIGRFRYRCAPPPNHHTVLGPSNDGGDADVTSSCKPAQYTDSDRVP